MPGLPPRGHWGHLAGAVDWHYDWGRSAFGGEEARMTDVVPCAGTSPHFLRRTRQSVEINNPFMMI